MFTHRQPMFTVCFFLQGGQRVTFDRVAKFTTEKNNTTGELISYNMGWHTAEDARRYYLHYINLKMVMCITTTAT